MHLQVRALGPVDVKAQPKDTLVTGAGEKKRELRESKRDRDRDRDRDGLHTTRTAAARQIKVSAKVQE